MEPYEFLDHTADVKFRAYGKTLEELFSNVVLAFSKLITEDALKAEITKEVHIEASDLEQLLFSFLDELIFIFDTEYLLPVAVQEIEIKKSNKYVLKAIIEMDKAKGKDIINAIKSVTYHDLFVKKEKDIWVAQVILDV